MRYSAPLEMPETLLPHTVHVMIIIIPHNYYPLHHTTHLCDTPPLKVAATAAVVYLKIEFRVKLVLHHAPVANQTAGGQVIQRYVIQRGNLQGTSSLITRGGGETNIIIPLQAPVLS